MSDHKKDDGKKIVKKESRTKEIANMISEGGLGAEKYYDINKSSSPSLKEIGLRGGQKNDSKED